MPQAGSKRFYALVPQSECVHGHFAFVAVSVAAHAVLQCLVPSATLQPHAGCAHLVSIDMCSSFRIRVVDPQQEHRIHPWTVWFLLLIHRESARLASRQHPRSLSCVSQLLRISPEVLYLERSASPLSVRSGIAANCCSHPCPACLRFINSQKASSGLDSMEGSARPLRITQARSMCCMRRACCRSVAFQRLLD